MSNLYMGLYLGILVSSILVNGFMFVRFKNKLSCYYGLYVILMATFHYYYYKFGLCSGIVWNEHSFKNQWLICHSGALAVVGVLFSRYYLGTHEVIPFTRFENGIIGLIAGCMFLCLVLVLVPIALILVHFAHLSLILYLMYCAIYFIRRGRIAALYYLLAICCISTGAIGLMARHYLHMLPDVFVFNHIFPICCVLEILVFGYALLERMPEFIPKPARISVDVKQKKEESGDLTIGLDEFNAFSRKKQCEKLSSNEWEVLLLMEKGLSNKQIAEKICLSYEAVRSRAKTIYLKLQIEHGGEESRTVAIAYVRLANTERVAGSCDDRQVEQKLFETATTFRNDT